MGFSKKKVELSIVIINYNTFDLTVKCIESIYRYTKNILFEIILVDNASTDEDPNKFLLYFPELILIKNKENVGFAKGNNIGIAKSKGEVVLLLNSDTLITNNAIGNAYQKLLELPNVNVITVKLIHPDGSIQHQCGKFPSIFLQLVELFRIQKLLPQASRERLLLGGFFDHLRPVYPDWIWGTFFMFKRSSLEYFPNKKLSETYFMYQEDIEWCYIINKNRKFIYYDPEMNVIHYFSSSSKTKESQDRKNYLLRTNYTDFLNRYYGKLYASLFFFFQDLNRRIQF